MKLLVTPILLLFSATVFGKIEVEIYPYSEVPANKAVRLSLISSSASQNLAIRLKNLEVLPAHAAKQKFFLSGPELARIIQEKDETLNQDFTFKIPDQIVIEPVDDPLTKNEVQEQILEFAQSNCAGEQSTQQNCKVQIKNLQVPHFYNDSGVVEWKLDLGGVQSKGAVLIPLKIQFKNNKEETGWVKAQIFERRLAAVARRTLRAGDSLKSEDMEEKWTDTTFLRGSLLRSDEMKNMLMKKYIPAGQMITLDDVKPEPACQKGQVVQLLAGNESLEITVQATAEESGQVGDSIKVKLLDNQKILSAVVSDKGAVRLQ